MTDRPLILWFRRDFRLSDHPMLSAAEGRRVIPVYILDPETEALGAAARFRLELAIARFAESLEQRGLRLILRRGQALPVLLDLIAKTYAEGVLWQRMYDPASKARDTAVKSALRQANHRADSFGGAVLAEPWSIETGQGGYYKVYTPFWKALSASGVEAPVAAPRDLLAPEHWPQSDVLADWGLGKAMRRGAEVVAAYQRVGERAAFQRLDHFIAASVDRYKADRDFLALEVTSGLSENLAWGEIGPRSIWAAGMRAKLEGAAGAEHFLKELVWRDFAYHLLHHFPPLETECWRPEWQDFPWRGDNEQAEAWRRGMTGEPFVDAAMREMYVTGRMHNRARMIVASYLTKHLMTNWRVGQAWFADCLTDFDPAANAMGWQWVAGCGPDAAPYFRVFNPEGQAEKFDQEARYRRRWIAEMSPNPGQEALNFFRAVPQHWALDPKRPYPSALVELSVGRKRALAAYAARKT